MYHSNVASIFILATTSCVVTSFTSPTAFSTTKHHHRDQQQVKNHRTSSSLNVSVDPDVVTKKEFQDVCGVNFNVEDRLVSTNYLYPKHVEVLEDFTEEVDKMVDDIVSLDTWFLMRFFIFAQCCVKICNWRCPSRTLIKSLYFYLKCIKEANRPHLIFALFFHCCSIQLSSLRLETKLGNHKTTSQTCRRMIGMIKSKMFVKWQKLYQTSYL
jgi:hypothetical protein